MLTPPPALPVLKLDPIWEVAEAEDQEALVEDDDGVNANVFVLDYC